MRISTTNPCIRVLVTHIVRKAMRFTAIATAMAVAIAVLSCDNEGSGKSAGTAQGLNSIALRELRKDAGDEQAAMLEDGKISFDEYEQAILPTIRCISNAGITVGPPELKYQRKYYWYDWEIPGDRADQLFPKLDACTSNWQPVVDGWYLENAPAEEDIASGRRALVTCLRDAGIDIPTQPTEQDFARFRSSPSRDFIGCTEKVREEFGLIGFAG